MRKSFFTKAIVAVGVMASALALSNMVVLADSSAEKITNPTAIADATEGTYIASVVTSGVGSKETAPTAVAVGESHTLNIQRTSGTGSSFTLNNHAYSGAAKISANVGQNVTNVDTAETLVLDIYVNGDADGTLYFNEGSAASDSSNTASVSLGGKAPTQVEYNVNSKNTVYFTCDKQVLLGAVAIKSASADKYTITDSDKYVGSFSFEESDSGDVVTVSYVGSDYYMENTDINISDWNDNGDETYSYSANDLVLNAKRYTIVPRGKDGATGTFTLNPNSALSYGESLTITYSGDDYTMSAQTVTINETVAAASELASGSNVNYTYTADVSSAMKSTDIPVFVEKINFNSLTLPEKFNSTYRIANNKIMVTGVVNKVLSGTLEKSINLDDGQENVTLGKYVNTNGSGDKNKRGIRFKTKSDGKVYIYLTAGSGSNSRKVKVNDGTNETVIASSVPKNSEDPTSVIVDTKAGVEYSVYADGNLFIYYVGSTVELDEMDATFANSDVYNKAGAYLDNNKFYIVSVVKGTDAETAATLDLTYNNTSILDAPSTKAYSKVKFDGDDKEYTAVDFGGTSSDYLFAVEISEGIGESKVAITNVVTEIQKVQTVLS